MKYLLQFNLLRKTLSLFNRSFFQRFLLTNKLPIIKQSKTAAIVLVLFNVRYQKLNYKDLEEELIIFTMWRFCRNPSSNSRESPYCWSSLSQAVPSNTVLPHVLLSKTALDTQNFLTTESRTQIEGTLNSSQGRSETFREPSVYLWQLPSNISLVFLILSNKES